MTFQKIQKSQITNAQIPQIKSQLASRPFALITKQTTSIPTVQTEIAASTPHQPQKLQRKTNLLEIPSLMAMPKKTKLPKLIQAKLTIAELGDNTVARQVVQRPHALMQRQTLGISQPPSEFVELTKGKLLQQHRRHQQPEIQTQKMNLLKRPAVGIQRQTMLSEELQMKARLKPRSSENRMVTPDLEALLHRTSETVIQRRNQEPEDEPIFFGMDDLDISDTEDPTIADPSILNIDKEKSRVIPFAKIFFELDPSDSINKEVSIYCDYPIIVKRDLVNPSTNKKGYVFNDDISGISQDYWVEDTNTEPVAKEPEFEKTNEPLFPVDITGKQILPSVDDVKQASIGDCYLEAAIASIAKTNPQYIISMFDDYGDTVRVRLYDVNTSSTASSTTFTPSTPRYIKVEKSVVKSRTGELLYNKGSLWVHILQKAYAAAGFGGNASKTADQNIPASYDKIEGGNSAYALCVLLGRATESENQYFSSGEAQDSVQFQQSAPGKLGLSVIRELPWSKQEWQEYFTALNASKLKGQPENFDQLVSYKIFNDVQKVHHWMKWLCSDGFLTILDLYDNKKSSARYQEEIRLEDLELMFKNESKSYPELKQLTPNLINYLKHYFPGKRGTGKYTEKQLDFYDKIEDKLKKGHFVTISSKEQVGRSSTGSGHSAGEPMSKGLVGNHTYTVMGYEYDSTTINSLRYIKLRNAWGEYGRDYEMKATKSSGGQARENKQSHTEFKVELSDLTKRFDWLNSTL
ncbi:C2 family cysteine protease [Nostoc sp. NMS4]|uniref:C2 family cysteine protease n=1 Tax=Nostoc sp. NMS4 TaxID=2815390 RepID=UPI0025CE0793|nr:C2 family cysteine protease [Nostoc sp. NMS4]MBN3922545.1 hypothetical protein [Nostoc sp. NMS4]